MSRGVSGPPRWVRRSEGRVVSTSLERRSADLVLARADAAYRGVVQQIPDARAGVLNVAPARSPRRRSIGLTSTIEDTVEVDAPPETVWAWLSAMADHYRQWHPDHIGARWIRGEPGEIGSRMEATERLAGHREILVFEMTAVDPPRRMEYRILGPHAILVPKGRFLIAERGHASVFSAELDIRLGRLVAMIFPRRMRALRAHMHEEGLSLKRLVEQSLAPVD